MIYNASPLAIAIFIVFVAFVIGLSFWLGRKKASASSYFAAGGSIHWSINGIAFAGDYLSAASFLGICGMIATAGYDGFLYSIGFLAGWIVALFVIAEPLKRLGRYTFTDAINAKYDSRGIQVTSAVSTLVVSVCYLIPQMVGAGDIITPLLGFDYWVGVVAVGAIVIVIVATAGMKSTTYVQFIKGGLLIIFSLVIAGLVIVRGLSLTPTEDSAAERVIAADNTMFAKTGEYNADGRQFVRLSENGVNNWWMVKKTGETTQLVECLSKTGKADGSVLYMGLPKDHGKFLAVGRLEKIVVDGKETDSVPGLNPFNFLSIIEDSTVLRYAPLSFKDGTDSVTIWYQNPTPGTSVMRPGLKFKVDEGSDFWSKLNFISLMIALFFGTASLPHVLIRYYTVPNAASARKSTIVAITAIGVFYILTMYMGLGAMTGGVMDVESSNMAAPLLARSFNVVIFAIICAIAFATILGTVSGLIVAASGAVAHDFIKFFKINISDDKKVVVGKATAFAVGGIAILLGLLFKTMNVSFLVGLAFAVAASANLPAIIMMLFWKGTTKRGIAFSIIVGIVSSIGIIMLSPAMFPMYGLPAASAPIPLDQPGIISMPLSFITLIVVSLLTKKKTMTAK
ncbi:MAG: cation acetate symporter [Spirochaetaceae bacterium]|nr:MAG: cation acetate symporter [Spirochaetaceae bacterium]